MLKPQKLLFLLFFISVGFVVNAAQFDTNLKYIATLRDSKKHVELLRILETSKASEELEDLRLFLLGETQTALRQEEEAYRTFTLLISKYPENETTYQARFQHFTCALAIADETWLARLESYARNLPTAWQRGTAFQKIAQLPFIKTGRKSRTALASLREHISEKFFYQNIATCNTLLKEILTNPQEWLFEDAEWIEILLLASSEGVIKHFFTNNDLQLQKIFGTNLINLFKAEHFRIKKNNEQALSLYNSAINTLQQPLKTLAIQLRADFYYFANKYELAIADYRTVLKNPVPPANVTAARYRLMRSSYELGRDIEALEMIGYLVQDPNAGTLFPIHLYEMGLSYYDKGLTSQSVPYFMALAQNFPGHYRAHAALGYAALAMSKSTKDAKTLADLLNKKYPNSFFNLWINPNLINTYPPMATVNINLTNPFLELRQKAWLKLWNTELSYFAIEEVRKLTNNYPLNLELYYRAINTANQVKDYNQLTAYGDRYARQLLESGASLSQMPSWIWHAMYPLAYSNIVEKYSSVFRVDKHWILSIMREESHFKEDTLSRSNAMGLMQILPSTGKWIATKLAIKNFKQNDLWNPEQNIRFGTWYLNFLQDMFENDLYLASAAYNGGQGNIQRKVLQGPHAALPVLEKLDKVPLPETRDYYKKVMGSYFNYKRLYRN